MMEEAVTDDLVPQENLVDGNLLPNRGDPTLLASRLSRSAPSGGGNDIMYIIGVTY